MLLCANLIGVAAPVKMQRSTDRLRQDKKALNPYGERLFLHPGTRSNAAAIAASRTSFHRELILGYC
jgi:hypothetical protein